MSGWHLSALEAGILELNILPPAVPLYCATAGKRRRTAFRASLPRQLTEGGQHGIDAGASATVRPFFKIASSFLGSRFSRLLGRGSRTAFPCTFRASCPPRVPVLARIGLKGEQYQNGKQAFSKHKGLERERGAPLRKFGKKDVSEKHPLLQSSILFQRIRSKRSFMTQAVRNIGVIAHIDAGNHPLREDAVLYP